MILSCSQITKSFADQTIISKGSFHIEKYEKVALVGMNGAGKSTLLKIIMNQLPADEGVVSIAKGATIGYLSQHQDMEEEHSIIKEVESAKAELIHLESQIREMEIQMKSLSGDKLEEKLQSYHKITARFEQENGYAYRSEIIGVLKGLGFTEDDFSRSVHTLSGGQKTRVALGKLLLSTPDILLLDEPTNHLDMQSITWLETFLKNYKGAVLLVSHDRYFINKVATKIVEIENAILETYLGNYSEFSFKKAQLREAKIKEYLKQQQEIKHQEKVIEKLKSFNREKSIKRAESREKLLDKIERIEKPVTINTDMSLKLEPEIISGNDVLTVNNISKSFNTLLLFNQVNFEIKRGERVAIIGDNGTGKSTLLKLLNEVISLDSGEIVLGSNVHIGYYDQEHAVLDLDKTIFDNISDAFPSLSNTKIRNTLAAFLFTGDDVFKSVSSLSGGERGRVSLAKLMLSEGNLLILDEPTNHLDVASKEILENALVGYSGTVIFVSHDRYFINQTATRILELKNKQFVNYIGNYDYYLEKKEMLSAPPKEVLNSNTPNKDSSTKLDWREQKEQQAQIRKRERQLKETEERIEVLELKSQELDSLLADPSVYADAEKCIALSQEKNDTCKELEKLYEDWEVLST